MAYSSIKRTPIKQKKCKEVGCEKYPVTGMNGFCLDHVPQLLKEEKVNRHNKSKREAQKRAISRKKLHEVQKEVGLPISYPKSSVRQKPIPKFSKKRLADLKIYNVLRKDYLLDKPECEVRLLGCKKKSVEIHHLFSGSDRNKYFTVVETWKATCRSCHRKIHDELSTEQLVELGLRKFDSTNSSDHHDTDTPTQLKESTEQQCS